MITKLAEHLSGRWLRENIITEDLYDCYVYGVQIILLALLGIINILVIGICTNTLKNAVAFLLPFIVIREFTGGYHADNCIKCNLCFSLLYLLNLCITYGFRLPAVWMVFLAGGSGLVVICAIGPVENVHKPLSSGQKKVNRNFALFLSALCCAVSVLFIPGEVTIAVTISVTLMEIWGLMIAETVIHPKFIQ